MKILVYGEAGFLENIGKILKEANVEDIKLIDREDIKDLPKFREELIDKITTSNGVIVDQRYIEGKFTGNGFVQGVCVGAIIPTLSLYEDEQRDKSKSARLSENEKRHNLVTQYDPSSVESIVLSFLKKAEGTIKDRTSMMLPRELKWFLESMAKEWRTDQTSALKRLLYKAKEMQS